MPQDPDPTINLRTAIGDRIRDARLRGNLTQEAVGEAAGLDRRTIQRVERGEADARLSWLIRIAQAVGRPLAELVAE